MRKIILILALTLLVMFSGCKKEVEEPVVEAEPEVVEPVVEAEPEVTLPESASPQAVVETVTGQLDMISEARCIDNRIEAVLTNPTSETFTLGKTAKVILNGLIVVDPECDKSEIAAGESVYCADISGHYAIRQGELNRIQVNMASERGISNVDCKEE